MIGALFIQCAVSFAATVAFSVLFHAPRSQYAVCGLTGMAGWGVYWLAVQMGASVVLGSFLGAVALAALTRIFSVVFRCPSAVYITAGIFPLVPGAGIYYTVYHFIMGNNAACLDKGVETLKIAVVIALGILVVLSLPRGVFHRLAGDKPKAP